MKPAIGIIGTGNFGSYLAKWLAPHADVRLAGRQSSEPEYRSAFDAQAVVLAVPFSAYSTVLEKMSGKLDKRTIVVDVCSTKELPVQTISQKLPGQPVLALHPLFGPETATDSLAGHKVVLCPQPGMAKVETMLSSALKHAGLQVIEMSAPQHDQQMAEVQGLTFFVARALLEYGIEHREISTPSYRRLLNLVDLERHHTRELFNTIQSNPYAAEVRNRFVETAEKLNDELNHG